MPTVSVIVPTRQRSNLVGRAVCSILSQTFTDFEIVVVDSNLGDLQIARYPERAPWLSDPRVRLVENSHAHNAASARNLGLANARGKWITYLDDDDTYHPKKLERQWCAADSSGLPLGSCGVVYHLSGRRRLVPRKATEIWADDLLLQFLGMPTVFHRRAPDVRFNESLGAGEDMYYFQRLVQYYEVSHIFHVPLALVNVYPQPGARVNLYAQGAWQACEATLRDFGENYTEVARSVFRDRGRLGFCKLERGHFREMLTICAALFRQRGVRDTRLILNCLLFRLPWMRRWLVC